MAKAIDKQTVLDLIIEAKRADPETGSFAEWLAEYLVEHLPTLTPPNEPLTLEQLREMDGEPVWIVDIGGRNWYGPGWAIVDRENNLVRTVKNWNPVFFERYGERWLAYRRPKEGEEDT